jgi:hypothetical protein
VNREVGMLAEDSRHDRTCAAPVLTGKRLGRSEWEGPSTNRRRLHFARGRVY